MTNKEIEEKIKELDDIIPKLIEAVNSLNDRLCELENSKEDKRFEYDLSLGQIKSKN